MNYFIKRDLQEYGPYTLAELQRYTGTGNVLLTDLSRGEGMTDWVPVSQVLANAPAPVAPAFTPSERSATATTIYSPPPPSLHWGIAVVLGVITCGVFGWVWALVQASWMKKVAPASKALLYYGIAIGLFVVSVLAAVAEGQHKTATPSIFNFAGAVLWVIAAFSMRSSIREYFSSVGGAPSTTVHSGVMTFFFNIYYFQYHFTKLKEQRARQGIYP